jgi:hypothetical protein
MRSVRCIARFLLRQRQLLLNGLSLTVEYGETVMLLGEHHRDEAQQPARTVPAMEAGGGGFKHSVTKEFCGTVNAAPAYPALIPNQLQTLHLLCHRPTPDAKVSRRRKTCIP